MTAEVEVYVDERSGPDDNYKFRMKNKWAFGRVHLTPFDFFPSN
jgi:hypothetical protein